VCSNGVVSRNNETIGFPSLTQESKAIQREHIHAVSFIAAWNGELDNPIKSGASRHE
jgi:hypothetical protein